MERPVSLGFGVFLRGAPAATARPAATTATRTCPWTSQWASRSGRRCCVATRLVRCRPVEMRAAGLPLVHALALLRTGVCALGPVHR